jgi:methionyl-tRNA formyltransferase
MNVALFGQKWPAENLLLALCEMPGVAVTAVVPDGSAERPATPAKERGIPTYALEDCPPGDLVVSAHMHRFVPGPVRSRFRLGVLAYHPSLLSVHRGRDAVRRAIHMRERVTGERCIGWMTARTQGR